MVFIFPRYIGANPVAHFLKLETHGQPLFENLKNRSKITTINGDPTKES